MGSIFSTRTPTPPPPPPPSIVRDEINRVEQVPVTNADGSVTYITRQIPLSEAEQREQDELKRIMDDALSEIEKLSSSNVKDDPDTKRVLSLWAEERQKLVANNYTEREQLEEQALAQRGLSDSSAAQSIRRQRRLDRQDALENISREQDLLAQDIRREEIGLQQNLYNIAASQTNAETARKQQAALAGQSRLIATDLSNRASLNDYYSRNYSQSGNSPFSLFGKAAGTALGTAVGGPIGGAVGGTVGGSLGSLFSR